MSDRQTSFLLQDSPIRRPQRRLMHVTDAGDGSSFGCETICTFRCRCGYESDWIPLKNITEAKRGLPCPACNKEKSDV